MIAYEPAWPSVITTDALVRLELLAGEAHEGMTTAPDQCVDAVVRFLEA